MIMDDFADIAKRVKELQQETTQTGKWVIVSTQIHGLPQQHYVPSEEVKKFWLSSKYILPLEDWPMYSNSEFGICES